CALLQNAMRGRHPSDLFSLNEDVELPNLFPGVEGMRVALSLDLGFVPIDAEVERNTRATAELLQNAGATVEEVALGWTASATRSFRDHAAVIFGAWIADYLDAHRSNMTSYAISLGESAAKVTAKDFITAMNCECEMWDALSVILTENDLLICPTLG